MNIVIAGKFSPPVLACIRSWGKNGHRVGFINVDHPNGINPDSKYLDSQFFLNPSFLFQDKGIREITAYLRTFKADVFSCIDDKVACWLSDNRTSFDEKIILAVPPSGMIKAILSKKYQNKLAKQIGFNILPEYLINKHNKENISVPSGYFPLCLRPSETHHTQPHFKVELIHSAEHLIRFLKTININENGIIIAQPYKKSPNLVVHGLRTAKGNVRRLSSFIVERKFEGVTLTIKPYPDVGSTLLAKCGAFVKAAELTGNFHFEFLFDPKSKKAFFLEINHRFGGTTAKVLACGYDEPLYALEAYGLAHPGKNIKIKNRTVSNKQALIKYMAKAVAGKLSVLDYPDEPLVKRITAGFKGLMLFGDEVFCRDDLRGSLSLYLGNLLQQLNFSQRH